MINWLKKLSTPKNEGGASPLTSQYSIPGYVQFQCDIADIEHGPDKDAQRNPKIVEKIHRQIEEEGLRWPIILRKGTDKPYKAYIGNNRVSYAESKGYTSITAILVENAQEKLQIVQYTRQIDQHGFDSE